MQGPSKYLASSVSRRLGAEVAEEDDKGIAARLFHLVRSRQHILLVLNGGFGFINRECFCAQAFTTAARRRSES
jgi:hypothetical protein